MRQIKPYLGRNPLFSFIFDEIKAQGITRQEITRKAGVAYGTLDNMKRRGSTRLMTYVFLLEALGYELQIVAKEPEENGKRLPRFEASA
jgi:hypothetical protein